MLHEILINAAVGVLVANIVLLVLFIIGRLSLKFGFKKNRNQFEGLLDNIKQIAEKEQEIIDLLKHSKDAK